ncbi:DUF2225 domain-containing protein [Bacillus sp. Marseille-P3661]|uniref:DUF2225 domain-containing protein n=1 Tax=Bacillus sp. Marseille-P3661 TaxID=1936234 RepID=UPI000C828B45|nr:DUF2225 domain-containing protein [Bacillus sp. Marseille-P3661]
MTDTPDSENPLYDRSIKCLLCEFTFKTKKVRSKFKRAGELDTDFFTDYLQEDANPLLYYINVCPSCGYAFSDEASTYFLPGVKEKLFDNITRRWRGQSHYGDVRSNKTAIDSYKLAILSGSLKNEKPLAMAGILLRLSWIYRIEQNLDQEKRFLRHAVEAFEKSYYEGDLKNSKLSTIRLLYLMGELYRKLDNPNKAIVYFSKVISLKNQTKEKKFVEMAHDRWFQIREEQNRSTKD